MKKIDCVKCEEQSSCCSFGAWVDLEEAKKISTLGLKGIFYHLEPDKDFPSGYRVGTSYEDNSCSFLTVEGLCAIHKIDYSFKPAHCKEFPYENGKLSSMVNLLCAQAKLKKKTKKITR
ncbi:MAG: hypothetical protein AABZ65_03960 [Candidatus Omnitrophota bacterium]